MQLSELLGLPVHGADDRHIGTVIDVRLHLVDGSPPKVVGLLVSPRSRSSYLGYERAEDNRPRALSAYLRWRHRDTFLAGWEDVELVEKATSGCAPDSTGTRPCYDARFEPRRDGHAVVTGTVPAGDSHNGVPVADPDCERSRHG